MKKAIRLIFYVLAACLFTLSCTKSDANKFALLGTWELEKTDVYVNGRSTTEYPHGMVTTVEFRANDRYTWTEVSIDGSTIKEGRWIVEGDTVTLTESNGFVRVFVIVDTSLVRLVMKETVVDEKTGVVTVYTDTYKYVSRN